MKTSLIQWEGVRASEWNDHLTPTATSGKVNNSNNLEEIIQKLMEKYEVTEEKSQRDLWFLTELYKRNMVLEIPIEG